MIVGQAHRGKLLLQERKKEEPDKSKENKISTNSIVHPHRHHAKVNTSLFYILIKKCLKVIQRTIPPPTKKKKNQDRVAERARERLQVQPAACHSRGPEFLASEVGVGQNVKQKIKN